MKDDGKFVRCLAPSPDWAGPREVNRNLCFLRKHPQCGACPHNTFSIHLRRGIGDQVVACPRWNSDAERLRGHPLIGYAAVRRELCLTVQPFPWCSICKNRDPGEPPREQPGWFEHEPRQLRVGVFEEDDEGGSHG